MTAARLAILTLAIFATLAIIALVPKKAHAANVRIGILTCHLDGGFGAVLVSIKSMACSFDPVGNQPLEAYDGAISKVGVDIGATAGGKLAWAVLAPSLDVAPGALEGWYRGLSVEATPGVGIGANLLVGGYERAISLQPLSLQGQVGLNVAAAISTLRLTTPTVVIEQPIVVKP